MRKNWVKWVMIAFLSVTFLNRGLFISDSGTETVCANPTQGETNSLLELIMSFAGLHNTTDEDGDTPESYHVSTVFHPIFCQDFAKIELHLHAQSDKNDYVLFDEIILSTPIYKQIDRPPKDFRS